MRGFHIDGAIRAMPGRWLGTGGVVTAAAAVLRIDDAAGHQRQRHGAQGDCFRHVPALLAGASQFGLFRDARVRRRDVQGFAARTEGQPQARERSRLRGAEGGTMIGAAMRTRIGIARNVVAATFAGHGLGG